LIFPSSTLTAGKIHDPLSASPKHRRAISSILGVQCALDMQTRAAVPEGAKVRALFFGVNFGDVCLQGCSGFYLNHDLMHGLELWLGIPSTGKKERGTPHARVISI